MCVYMCVCVFHLEGQDTGDEGSAVDLGDVSSLHHGDGLQLLDRIHRNQNLTSTFRVVPPDTNTHLHTAGAQFSCTVFADCK